MDLAFYIVALVVYFGAISQVVNCLHEVVLYLVDVRQCILC